LKADLHIHSIYSPDAITKPETILSVAADRGIDIIAITDHDSSAGWKHFAEIQNNYPVQVIFGQEIKVFQGNRVVGEILGLFLEKPVMNQDTRTVIREIIAQNGVASIAHPFSERRHEFFAYTEIDNWSNIAIETRNGRTYNQRDNEMAMNLAAKLHTPVTAGSDAHTPFEIGNVYLEFSGKTPQDLQRAILNHDVKVCGRPSSVLFSIISGFGRLGIAI
jgi:predicted metal-dependent phosphoesterase TrpH